MNPISVVISTLQVSIHLANQVQHARNVSMLLRQQLINTLNILQNLNQVRRQELERLPEIAQLTAISSEIHLFLQEARTPVQLFRILMGQFRMRAAALDQQLSNAMRSLTLNLVMMNVAERNKAIETDVMEADQVARANPRYTMVRDTFTRTQANANILDFNGGGLDGIIQKFFTRRNYIMALGPLFNYFQHGNAMEQKKAALFLGHCYRLWASSTTNEVEARSQRDLSLFYYSAAYELGSCTAGIYLSQYFTATGDAETANVYLERYMLTQEPDRTMFR
ncbi:hypothetical protein HDU96_001729 [Phlyctochytrium bullatum]|nr:hypothetical protein HDU96_001729 [Phlyctochytrium bullatum]